MGDDQVVKYAQISWHFASLDLRVHCGAVKMFNLFQEPQALPDSGALPAAGLSLQLFVILPILPVRLGIRLPSNG